MTYNRQEVLKKIISKNNTKMVLLVMDGIGDVPLNGKTPLMVANTPNLDKLAQESELGQTIPVLYGVTPGSGPAHLSLFGYDPLKYEIGRGILEALGIDVEVGEKDMVARGNFATVEGDIVVDRRAGRPATEENVRVCQIINSKIKEIKGVKVQVFPGKEHRFVVKFTGDNLSDKLSDADPQKNGLPIVFTEPTVDDEASKFTAEVVNEFLKKLKEVLKDEPKLNFGLLRGFSKYPDLPNFEEVYQVKAAAIATYPMYKGLAKLVGMNVISTGQTIEDEVRTLKEIYNDYDFFYFHVKKTDSYGEDGNFDMKVKVIEETDSIIPEILSLKPDVLVVTGDHSTPAFMKSHSWHPVPYMLYSRYTRKGLSNKFDEFECARGTLGTFYALDSMSLILAHAQRLEKYGA
ncbi:MAG: 2,3-bisphosphoglycerate-independent phosphoglycerate mutase [Thermotogaceae bacterium]|jgi:2,3-bisphosphoglycerate-independent phosphoglycerate mutase|nr:2,3-bisphosphoglycerate-independent phosphoglycerate mutase [Thermotogaceae bacterium]MDN5338409.1 2,3-bisphosphoglycerate-independent phosphoglycerate mutase [Thermotogaceae bacterium]